jgi:hypothetical protein
LVYMKQVISPGVVFEGSFFKNVTAKQFVDKKLHFIKPFEKMTEIYPLINRNIYLLIKIMVYSMLLCWQPL